MTALKALRIGRSTGRDATSPCNLPKAMKLPVRVTEPTIVEAMMVTTVTEFSIGGAALSRSNSAAATNAETPPPNPLKTATICGMAVICTVRDMYTPITEPTTRPMIIHSGSTMSAFTRVNTTARSMPTAESMLPERAVAGERSRISPRMNNAPAIM